MSDEKEKKEVKKGEGKAQEAAAKEEKPAKKKRKKWVIALIVILVSCCFISGCIATVLGYWTWQRNRVQDIVERADSHYNKAMDILEETGSEWEEADLEDPQSAVSELKKLAASSKSKTKQAKNEVNKAEGEIKKIGKSKLTTIYLEACSEATKGIEALENMADYVGQTGGLFQKILDAVENFNQGNNKLNDAIDSNNARKHTRAKKEAAEAIKLFRQAENIFREAHKIDPSAGLDKATAYVAKYREQASICQQLADAGRRGSLTTYNKLIDRLNNMTVAITKMKEPDIITDPKWGQNRLDELGKEIDKHMEKADELMEKVAKICSEGDY